MGTLIAVLLIAPFLGSGGDSDRESESESSVLNPDKPSMRPVDSPPTPMRVEEDALPGTGEPEPILLASRRAFEVVAELANNGVVVCDAPRLAEFRLLGVQSWHRVGGKVVLEVNAESGGALVFPLRPPGSLLLEDEDAWTAAVESATTPVATLEWRGADAGAVGVCDLLSPSTVRVRGVVEGWRPPYAPGGCPTKGQVFIGPGGAFEMALWSGPPCVLKIAGDNRAAVPIETTRDIDGLRLKMPDISSISPASARESLSAETEIARAELEEYDLDRDTYSRALARVSEPEVRAVLTRLREEEYERIEKRVDDMETLLEMVRSRKSQVE